MLQVTCALILRESRLLCAQRSEAMSLPLKWEFPGGKLEPGELARECIVREIEEELNLQIQVLDRAPSIIHHYDRTKELELIPFVCDWIGGALEVREHAGVAWRGKGDIRELDWADADIAVLNWCMQHLL